MLWSSDRDKKSRLYNHRKKKPIKISSRCEQLSWVTGENAADPLDLVIDESDSDFSVCAFRFHLISHMYCLSAGVLLSPSEKVWKRWSCYRRENAARGRFAQAETAPLSPQTRRTCETCVTRATRALAGLCLLAWGDMFRSDEFSHFMINPRLCRLNISDNLCLICSQPANKLINNSLSSGRALKPNIQRASF